MVGDVNGDYYRFTSNDMSLIVEATGEAPQDATNLDWGQYASIAEGMYNYTKASPSPATTFQGYLQMDDGTRGADVLTTVSIVDVPLQNTHRRSYDHNNLQPRDQWSSVGLSANYKMAWCSSPTRVAAKLIVNVVLGAWGAILGDWNIDKSSYEYYKHSDINPQRGGGGAAVFEIATTGAVQITREILEDMMNELLLLQAQGKWANRGGDIPALEGTILNEMDQTIARWTLGTALPAAARGVRNYLCENPDGSRAVACFAKGDVIGIFFCILLIIFFFKKKKKGKKERRKERKKTRKLLQYHGSIHYLSQSMKTMLIILVLFLFLFPTAVIYLSLCYLSLPCPDLRASPCPQVHKNTKLKIEQYLALPWSLEAIQKFLFCFDLISLCLDVGRW